MRPSAAVRFGNPSLADPSDHRAEHHHVEHEGADDGDQLDAVHPSGGRRGRVLRGHPVQDEREDDDQQGVDDADGSRSNAPPTPVTA